MLNSGPLFINSEKILVTSAYYFAVRNNAKLIFNLDWCPFLDKTKGITVLTTAQEPLDYLREEKKTMKYKFGSKFLSNI